MGWKSHITLGDLARTVKVELTCKKCKRFRYIDISKVAPNHPARQKYLDEFEDAQICTAWGCGGELRLAVPPDSDSEGFQGGLT